MFCGGIKYSTGGLNITWRYEIFHGGGWKFQGGMEYSTERVQYFTEVSNIPQRYEIFHGGG